MNKNAFNAAFRSYVRDNLTPTQDERDFVSLVYNSVQQVLGVANSLQIGSFPRYTAITPLHDLDVLFVLGNWDREHHDPSQALEDLERQMRAEYENPTHYEVHIGRQTHSVTIRFLDGEEEVFSVDVVPAYINGQNEFGDDTYVVPEIARASRVERQQIREAVRSGQREMGWIKSDPRGYIAIASQTNAQNDDFRKAVKLVKGWRCAHKERNDSFALKSFHLEQAITTWVQQNPRAEMFDIVFEFFRRVPDFVRYPQFPDRADSDRNIDDYVNDLNEQDRILIIQARDAFLVGLEKFDEGDDVGDLLSLPPRPRARGSEEFLFDQGIPVLTEAEFSIVGHVQPRDGGFRAFFLDAVGLINVDRKIEFRLGQNPPVADIFKWKVKNDDGCDQPRGEITDHQTKNDPESTRHNGNHYVECFAIRNGICVARSRQNVILRRPGQ
tara:strand:- start:237313 stop:238635 length:1323 start_codon:yes stop_codon:yes gene_type:complete